MKKLFFPLLLLLLSSACQKESTDQQEPPKADCEESNYGWIKIKNGSTDPVKVWLDGSYYGQLSVGETGSASRQNVGLIHVQAEQASGYIFTPDVWDFYMDAEQCRTNIRTLTQ